MDSRHGSLQDVKPGDKVRLKNLEEWLTAQDAILVVKRIGSFPDKGISRGALCEWISSRGRSIEKVFPIEDLAPATA